MRLRTCLEAPLLSSFGVCPSRGTKHLDYYRCERRGETTMRSAESERGQGAHTECHAGQLTKCRAARRTRGSADPRRITGPHTHSRCLRSLHHARKWCNPITGALTALKGRNKTSNENNTATKTRFDLRRRERAGASRRQRECERSDLETESAARVWEWRRRWRR
ncbi:uncharacterized protein LOC122253552 [Penaeus japonicus]|uniref:uncharacterized protein LOC122253552 n=1 Tax=Penaeus japonicus TaxID=27405 RepID=UPI001C70C2B2|nr:uncharacterized protein LOC122253552 [Penaeus japonicus]